MEILGPVVLSPFLPDGGHPFDDAAEVKPEAFRLGVRHGAQTPERIAQPVAFQDG